MSLIPLDLIANLRLQNPWWYGGALPVLPITKRHLVAQIRKRFSNKVAPIVVVRGSRQIGKTTSYLQLIEELIGEGVEPERILRIQFDELSSLKGIGKNEPILKIIRWYQDNVLRQELNEAARSNKPAYIFLDEVQNITDWAPQLKSLVDITTSNILVTGSSALRIEQGRDSLAGRITTIEAGVLSLTEIGEFLGLQTPKPFLGDNGLDKLKSKDFWLALKAYGEENASFVNIAFKAFSDRGAYPLVHKNPTIPWEEIADQLNETVIRRVIQHDLRIGERGKKRDENLLRELFRLCCRYAGMAPSALKMANEISQSLSANIGAQRIAAYRQFLADTLLIRLIQPLEIRLKKTKNHPKICLVDHGLRASWLQERIPLIDDPREIYDESVSTQAGFLAESVTGSLLSTIYGLDLSYNPSSNLIDTEIDFIISLGYERIPIEVKYRNRIDTTDTKGIHNFISKKANNSKFGILLTKNNSNEIDIQDIIQMPLSTLMLLR